MFFLYNTKPNNLTQKHCIGVVYRKFVDVLIC